MVHVMTEVSTGYLGKRKEGPTQVEILWEDFLGKVIPDPSLEEG